MGPGKPQNSVANRAEETSTSALEPGKAEGRGRLWTPLACVTLLFGLAPLFQIGAFLALVVLARHQNGRWPRFGDPDPTILGWSPMYITGLGLMGWWMFSIPSILAAAFARTRRPEFPASTIIPIAIFVALLTLAYLSSDPGGFLNWFWD